MPSILDVRPTNRRYNFAGKRLSDLPDFDIPGQIRRQTDQVAANVSQTDQVAANVSQADEDWQKILDLTVGARQSILDDPVMAEALDFQRGQMSGEISPLDDETLNRLIQASSIQRIRGRERARGALLRGAEAQGLLPHDPGFAAAMSDINLRSYGDRMAEENRIRAMAALENFRARQGGAQGTTGARLAQLGEANRMGLAGAGYLAQKEYPEPSQPGAVYQQTRGYLPQYTPYVPREREWPQPVSTPRTSPSTSTDRTRTGTNRNGSWLDGVNLDNFDFSPLVSEFGVTPREVPPDYEPLTGGAGTGVQSTGAQLSPYLQELIGADMESLMPYGEGDYVNGRPGF